MNIRKLLAIHDFGMNILTDEEWDFSCSPINEGVKGCLFAPVDHRIPTLLKILGIDEYSNHTYWEILGIPLKQYKWIIPSIDVPLSQNPYHKPLEQVTRKEVCNRLMKFIRWKLQRQHKWKQYLYSRFEPSVVDKTAVEII